ncbi:hypothetical protein PLESTM_000563800 [Pleodorina starrii]|nr:hypothetical protein PLESTM_000563800 [Pleodorina starrii]
MGSGEAEDQDNYIICTNAAQSYKAGWSRPIPGGHLNAFADLKLSVHQEFRLPPMHSTKYNMLRISVDPAYSIIDDSDINFQLAVFVSYRVRQSGVGTFDSGIQTRLDRRVW